MLIHFYDLDLSTENSAFESQILLTADALQCSLVLLDLVAFDTAD